jgi:hypothetical protein
MNLPRIRPLLRIATSVVCLTVCGLLIVLWVRSYWWNDVVDILHSQYRVVGFSSQRGSMHSYSGFNYGSDFARGWHAYSHRVIEAYLGPPHPLFELNVWQYGIIVRLPHWLLATVCGVVAIAPWVRWGWRFSLRTLLIGVSLLTVVLGLIVALQ